VNSTGNVEPRSPLPFGAAPSTTAAARTSASAAHHNPGNLFRTQTDAIAEDTEEDEFDDEVKQKTYDKIISPPITPPISTPLQRATNPNAVAMAKQQIASFMNEQTEESDGDSENDEEYEQYERNRLHPRSASPHRKRSQRSSHDGSHRIMRSIASSIYSSYYQRISMHSHGQLHARRRTKSKMSMPKTDSSSGGRAVQAKKAKLRRFNASKATRN